jgi:acyl-[acyl carrier protein]--UDP-N-acetylglucosamine O-acyltransferase
MLDQNKKRIFQKEKVEYTLRTINSIINSSHKALDIFKNLKIDLIITDDNSTKENLERIQNLLDKAKFNSTILGDGCKIDNLVQIAHNCILGKSCVMSGSSGLAGSVVLGDGVMIGGGAKIKDHVTLGSGVSVGACSGVISDFSDGKSILGYPAAESRDTLKQWVTLKKLAKS